MPVGIAWNAGALRARLLGRRRIGSESCRDLSRVSSLSDALDRLRAGPYGHDLEESGTLEAARWAVAATPLWHLRILAGWLPPAGAEVLRVLVGWWEVLNIENLVAGLSGAETLPPYQLGRLETAWDRVRTSDSLDALREALAASPWRDPGGDDPATIVTWLHLSWAERVIDEVDRMSRLAAAWATLVVARDLLLGQRSRYGAPAHGLHALGREWRDAEDLSGLSRRLPRRASWILEDVAEPEDLWHAEVLWWRTLSDEARGLLRAPTSGRDAVVGAFGVLLADAHDVQGALDLAARGGAEDEDLEELDGIL